jgi:type I restriction enzyme R subunit
MSVLYGFLSQILTFADSDLEKLYQFGRYLRRLLPSDPTEIATGSPEEHRYGIVSDPTDLEWADQVRAAGRAAAATKKLRSIFGSGPEELESLSTIIAELNERFGLNWELNIASL